MSVHPEYVERMDIQQMIARSQYWTGWCIDNETETPELVGLRYLLQSVTSHLQDERDAWGLLPGPNTEGITGLTEAEGDSFLDTIADDT